MAWPRRALLRAGAAVAGTLALDLTLSQAAGAARATDARVIRVKAGDRVAAALARAATMPAPVTILIAPGVYREKLHVAVRGVTLAASAPGVVIVNGDAAGHIAPDGRKWGTGRTATITVEAPRVTLRGLTIRNDFDYIADRISQASGGSQAVALSIARGADGAMIDRCVIEGYQDTLYVSAMALVDRCRIVGGVDFIFGGAAALFRGCEIVTRFVPDAPESGYVAAPSTLAAQRFGLVFDRCRLTREAGVPDRSTWLGRPWRAGGNMAILGTAAYLRCTLDAHIKREGWTAMHFADPSGVERMLQPEEARLFEWRSSGPGAGSASVTRRMLSDAEAAAYTKDAILHGWPDIDDTAERNGA